MIRKMKDRRYKKTEEKILAVFFGGGFSTMEELAKKAKIGRSTIYTHHHRIIEILSDWEEYILAEYHLSVQKRLLVKNTDARTMFFEMLVFILKHKKFFEIFLKFRDREIIIKMIFSIRAFKKSEKIFRVCTSEIAEVIFEWGDRGFPEEELGKTLSVIVYLAQTASDRLAPIL